MSDHIDKTISALQQKIDEHEREIIKVKSAINQLLEVDGKPSLYQESDMQTGGTRTLSIAPDEFFGSPLATSVKKILELRRALRQGPASTDDLYTALLQGGFVFENKNEAIAKRNTSITLSKNPSLVRLPNGMWGVRDWYEKIPKKTKDAPDAPELDDDGVNADGTQDARDNREEV